MYPCYHFPYPCSKFGFRIFTKYFVEVQYDIFKILIQKNSTEVYLLMFLAQHKIKKKKKKIYIFDLEISTSEASKIFSTIKWYATIRSLSLQCSANERQRLVKYRPEFQARLWKPPILKTSSHFGSLVIESLLKIIIDYWNYPL